MSWERRNRHDEDLSRRVRQMVDDLFVAWQGWQVPSFVPVGLRTELDSFAQTCVWGYRLAAGFAGWCWSDEEPSQRMTPYTDGLSQGIVCMRRRPVRWKFAKIVPQGLKPRIILAVLGGTTEVVPFKTVPIY